MAGVLLAGGYIFQTWGLDGATRTTPARAAFITGLYVVITPLLQAVLLRRRPRRSTLLGGAIALAGLWFLSGIGSDSGGWVFGDTLVVICAVVYSLHIIVLGSTGERHDVSALTLIQLGTVALVCGAISLVREQARPTDGSVRHRGDRDHRRVRLGGGLRRADVGATQAPAVARRDHPGHRDGVRGPVRMGGGGCLAGS